MNNTLNLPAIEQRVKDRDEAEAYAVEQYRNECQCVACTGDEDGEDICNKEYVG